MQHFKRWVWKPEKRTLVSTICFTSYFLWNLSVEDTFSVWSLEFVYPGPSPVGRLDMKHVVIDAASEWTKVKAKVSFSKCKCRPSGCLHWNQPNSFVSAMFQQPVQFHAAGRPFLNQIWHKKAANSMKVIRLFPLLNHKILMFYMLINRMKCLQAKPLSCYS